MGFGRLLPPPRTKGCDHRVGGPLGVNCVMYNDELDTLRLPCSEVIKGLSLSVTSDWKTALVSPVIAVIQPYLTETCD